MEKIILDTDIGVDDAFALRLALLKTKLVGVTTVTGNCTAAMAARNALLTLSRYHVKVPVCLGSACPLSGIRLEPSTEIHGSDGLGGVYNDKFSLDKGAPCAAQFIVEQARRMPGEITLCAIGPLTNVAQALEFCPELPSLLKALVIMGGAFGTHGHSGNMTPFAEFNIYCDPEAAEQVFASSLKTVLVPLDVTCEVLLTGKEVESLNDPFLTAISRQYLKYSLETEGFYGMAVHDALTIVYLEHPEFFTTVKSPVCVPLADITRAQTLRRPQHQPVPFDCFKGRPDKTICLEVDAQAVKQYLLTELSVKA